MTAKVVRISVKWFLIGVVFLEVCSYTGRTSNRINPYKQIHIPLDVTKGVPFSPVQEGEGPTIEGFDVDSNENFYFVGGKKAILACFSKDGKPVYRKSFLNRYPGPIHIVGKEIYYFETWNWGLNTLVVIDKTNGSLIREYPGTITKALKSHGYKSIDDYQFSDSALSITYTDSEGFDRPKTIYFDLKGQWMPNFDHHNPNNPAIEYQDSVEHLGKLGDNFVLGKFADERYDLILRNSSKSVVSTASVELNYFGKPLCGFSCLPQEHRKIRNGKLYMLNEENNMAVITEIDLATVFHVH